jgi:DNA-binding transcriptional ArsR family regulator
MPSADAALGDFTTPIPVRFEVRRSLVLELVWAAFFKTGESEQEFPARVDRFRAEPELEDRIRAFWGDGEGCFTEMFVAAERGGVLFETDADRLWVGLAEGAAAEPRFEPLTSETPEDQARFRSRLARLHDDPDQRARWLQLLRDVWAAIEARWISEGRDTAEALAWEIRTKVPDVGSYADLTLLVQGCDFGGLLPQLVGAYAASGRPVVLAPAWMGRKGFVVALTSCLLYGPGSPIRPAGPSAETRERARRHKALGDPTRLAIFEAAARRPRAVGELARELSLAQPTISNHVRILRDAGLLDQEKGGGRRLVADVARFEEFLEASRRAVVRPTSSITDLAEARHRL